MLSWKQIGFDCDLFQKDRAKEQRQQCHFWWLRTGDRQRVPVSQWPLIFFQSMRDDPGSRLSLSLIRRGVSEEWRATFMASLFSNRAAICFSFMMSGSMSSLQCTAVEGRSSWCLPVTCNDYDWTILEIFWCFSKIALDLPCWSSPCSSISLDILSEVWQGRG